MPLERPAPSAERNPGAPTTPRPAATVILLGGGAERLEVLLVQRSPAQRFMPGVWVFPGGAVDPGDGAGEPGLRAAAVRELAEEAGVRLAGPAVLVPVSRWITPRELLIRFDTRFYLTGAPAGARARVDESECVDLAWLTPADALAAHALGELALILPTIAHLERLGVFASADAALAHPWQDAAEAIEPRIVGGREVAAVDLPGEAGQPPAGAAR